MKKRRPSRNVGALPLLLCAVLSSCSGPRDRSTFNDGTSPTLSSPVDDSSIRTRAVDMSREVLRIMTNYRSNPWELLRPMSHPLNGLTVWIPTGATSRPTITVFQTRETVDTSHGEWTSGEAIDAWPSQVRQLLTWGLPRMDYSNTEADRVDEYAFVVHNRDSDSRLQSEIEFRELPPDSAMRTARLPDVDLIIKNYDSLRMYFTVHEGRLYLEHIVLDMGAS